MLNVIDLERALKLALPSDSHNKIPALARLIISSVEQKDTLNANKQPSSSREEVQELLTELAGRTIRLSDSALTFGTGNQFGDVRVRDIAKGNIINIQVSLSAMEQKEVLRTQARANKVATETAPPVERWDDFYFDKIEHILKDPEFYKKWAVVTLVGFALSIALSTGVYFSSSMSRPTRTVPNPI